ncbi:MAG: CpaF family protein, partial [Candidatus Altiarchaeales archaeon]|nr:CpaF family protein [Candidatus Altiarchaeales archaeon]
AINTKYILGYGILNPLLDDDDVEEILIDGYDKPVFILHRKIGKCRTNIGFSKEELEGFIRKVKLFSGETKDKVIIDAMLPPATRVNIAFPPASFGKPNISIKKFLQSQPSIAALIKNGTIPLNAATFLWMCVDDWGVESSNILITGGTSSGKTTLLNALLAFCRESERIVSLEDTLELDLSYLDDWVRMKTTEEIDLDCLIKNSLRQNPDRIIVGEVRGKEAYSLVAAMNVGRKGIGTVHGNTARETLLRMKSPPMNVPVDMLDVIDLIVVMRRYREGNKTIRKVIGIHEVGNVVGDILQLGEVYKYDAETKKTQFSHFPVTIMEKIADDTGLTEKEILKEFSDRMDVLKYLVATDVTSQPDFVDVIRSYYDDKHRVLKKIHKQQRSREQVK